MLLIQQHDNILIDEKSYENILVHNILYKTFIVQSHCILGVITWIDLLEFMMELGI